MHIKDIQQDKMVQANPDDRGTVADGPDEVIEDANVFKSKETDILTDDTALDFSVKNPQDFHGHVVYEVKGKDLQGEWECKRRYNEFFILYQCL